MPGRATFTPPEQLEEYRILRALGSGAMGQVYLAHDTLLDRSVAIKFIANLDMEQISASEMVERFFTEARAIARLQHPNVVLVYRVGEWQTRPYLVSEFVRGQSLDQIHKPLDWQRVHRIAIGLSRGLAAAHRRNVLHRDIKPANCMLTPGGEVKLLDFGLAKLMDITQVMSGPTAAFSEAAPPQEMPRDTQLDMLVPSEELPGEPASELIDTPSGKNVLADTITAGLKRPILATARSFPQFSTSAPAETPTNLALGKTLIGQSQSVSSKNTSVRGLTQYGDVVGSPLYIAPEIWRGEPATRRADIYSLGTLLYELCAGVAPYEGLTLAELPLRVQENEVPPLAEAAPGADPRFCAIVDRCLRRNPAARYESGDALRAALEQLSGGALAVSVPAGNPYRGLQSFEQQHRGLFYGRAAEVGAIIDHLRSESMVLVAGNSGVGKTSLCKAGVLVQIEAGALGAVQVVPWLPGRRPLAALAIALAAALGWDEAMLRHQLVQDPQQIGREICQRNRQSPSPQRILLFIDQMEELVTQGDAAETAQASEALAALLGYNREVCLLGTVRGDFLSRLVTLPGIGPEMARGLYLLGSLSPDGLREAITQPALTLGYAFESAAMVESLVTAAGQSEGGLPLLQFTLAALWEARDPERRIIPAAALQALGGVAGALARHADMVYERLPPRQQLAARRLLGQLITMEGSRTIKRHDELLGRSAEKEATAAALEALVAGRILSVRSDEAGAGSAYELAHEALLTGWGTLRVFLAEDAQLRALHQRLAQAAGEWERLGRGPDLLWKERQLAEAAAMADVEAEEMLAPREAAFLQASRRAQRMRRFGLWALVSSVPLLLFLIYAVSSLRARQTLFETIDRKTAEAVSELALARDLKQRMLSTRQAALRLFDARQFEEAEKLWAQVVVLDTDTRQRYRVAIRTAEAAFLLDTHQEQQRRLIASMLFDRALLSEHDHRLPRRDDLYQRMVLYDPDGTFQRQWEAPATLAIDSEPRGATVTLTAIDNDYHLLSTSSRSLGRTPLRQSNLPPGSYLLTIVAPSRMEVKYPLYLGRGESLPLRVTLPSSDQVPSGFVYIPAGRFFFGSDADEEMRSGFFNHVPMHEVSTGAFLIAQHETTFADWLLYLRALSPAERQGRLLPAGEAGMATWLSLQLLPDDKFELTMQRASQTYHAKEGERIVYPGRKQRQAQDWLRMPVAGISSEDALSYVDWLNRSGRLSGARLCTEQEWERAARGADGRIFPQGSVLQPDDANYDRTYDQRPLDMGLDEVGSHPASRSLFGIDDMVGNAFEWVVNSVSQHKFALRGGAYYYTARTARSDNRHEPEPSMRNPTAGIRICADVKPQL